MSVMLEPNRAVGKATGPESNRWQHWPNVFSASGNRCLKLMM